MKANHNGGDNMAIVKGAVSNGLKVTKMKANHNSYSLVINSI